ncbi:urease accessory protein D isoform X4 [Citrus sinensis]|uniref:urease accessory protein D isoform X4 n=1 Tax=Citrus sinensis TaxID=2711 RepID=UPI0022778732|nr:urease accessory protein D isoform X4 [Citrus sinensis]
MAAHRHREREREMESKIEAATGKLVVKKVGGKSTVTRCFSKYPLKFIIPNKVGSSETDAVWVYTLTYGGGIVSGDSISCEITVADACTAVLTTQASTKVYKSLGSKSSEQILEKQIFRVVLDSSLVIVDWITSGRHESGEKWDFELYRSTNHIFLEGDQPLFLDSVLLEQGSITNIAERMQDYQVIAMVILLGPKLKQIQIQVQENVRRMMSEQLYLPSTGLRPHGKTQSDHFLAKPSFVVSCSAFGPKGIGIVVRIAAMTTESVYRFLQHQLTGMETLLGVSPYS